MSQGLLKRYVAAAIVGGLHYRGQCVAHVCAQMSFLCVTASYVQRHKKYQVTLAQLVEQNMTSDLTAFGPMAYRNSLKFMTRAHMQVSKNRGADRLLVFLFYQVVGHYDQVPAPTQILQ